MLAGRERFACAHLSLDNLLDCLAGLDR
jgi:hypothetical protein